MPSFKAIFPCCFSQSKDEEGVVMRDVYFLVNHPSRTSLPPTPHRCTDEPVTEQPVSDVVCSVSVENEIQQVITLNIQTGEETSSAASAFSVLETCESYLPVENYYISVGSDIKRLDDISVTGQRGPLCRRHSLDSSNVNGVTPISSSVPETAQLMGSLYMSVTNDSIESTNRCTSRHRGPLVRRHSLGSSDVNNVANYPLPDLNMADELSPHPSFRTVRRLQSISTGYPLNSGFSHHYQYGDIAADVATESMLDQTPNLSLEDGEVVSNKSCVIDYLDPFKGFEAHRLSVSKTKTSSEVNHWG